MGLSVCNDLLIDLLSGRIRSKNIVTLTGSQNGWMDRAMMDEEKDKKSVTGDALRIRRHQTNMFAFDRCAVEFRGDTKEAITDVIIISCTVIRIIMKGGGRW